MATAYAAQVSQEGHPPLNVIYIHAYIYTPAKKNTQYFSHSYSRPDTYLTTHVDALYNIPYHHQFVDKVSLIRQGTAQAAGAPGSIPTPIAGRLEPCKLTVCMCMCVFYAWIYANRYLEWFVSTCVTCRVMFFMLCVYAHVWALIMWRQFEVVCALTSFVCACSGTKAISSRLSRNRYASFPVYPLLAGANAHMRTINVHFFCTRTCVHKKSMVLDQKDVFINISCTRRSSLSWICVRTNTWFVIKKDVFINISCTRRSSLSRTRTQTLCS